MKHSARQLYSVPDRGVMSGRAIDEQIATQHALLAQLPRVTDRRECRRALAALHQAKPVQMDEPLQPDQ